MRDYYIRCRTSELLELKRYLDKIGAIKQTAGVVTPKGNDAWDEIGPIKRHYAEGEEPKEGDVVLDTRNYKGGDVDPWYFINFRTDINLLRRMENRAEADPTLLVKFDDVLNSLRVRKVDGESEEIAEFERVFL